MTIKPKQSVLRSRSSFFPLKGRTKGSSKFRLQDAKVSAQIFSCLWAVPRVLQYDGQITKPILLRPDWLMMAPARFAWRFWCSDENVLGAAQFNTTRQPTWSIRASCSNCMTFLRKASIWRKQVEASPCKSIIEQNAKKKSRWVLDLTNHHLHLFVGYHLLTLCG